MTIHQTFTDVATNSKGSFKVFYAQVETFDQNFITVMADGKSVTASSECISDAMVSRWMNMDGCLLWTTNNEFSLADMIGTKDAEAFFAAYGKEVDSQ